MIVESAKPAEAGTAGSGIANSTPVRAWDSWARCPCYGSNPAQGTWFDGRALAMERSLPMNDTKKRAKSESGNYNMRQTSYLPFLECRKTGSSGFPASSSEPPAGSNEPPARSGGFPTGSNALRIFPYTLKMIQITPNNRVFSARTVYNPALSQGSYDARNRGQTPTSRMKSIWSPRFDKMRRP
jgi:hypothetical protein